MTSALLLVLMTYLVSILAGELNARYRQDPGEIGSLCSGLTPDLCSQQIPYVLVDSVLECAIRCTSHPRCKSFNYQVRPNSIGHTHRCEMASDKTHDINKDAKRSLGYQYYINVT